VRQLAPPTEREEVAMHLLSLVRKEMIRPEKPTYPDEEAFRFRHLLIRDAAYDSLPKETRAELHEAFADWLDQHATLVEQDEIVGYHLERAYRNRAELDGADPRLDGLARRAAARLAAAGRGAEARGDSAAMCGLLLRAASLLPEGDSQRLGTIFGLCEALNLAGRDDEARAVAAELASSPDERFQAFARLAENTNAAYASEWDKERGEANIAAARATFERLGDELGLALTEKSEWAFNWMSCQTVLAAAAARRAEAHARAAGDMLLADSMQELARRMLAYGPAHVDEAMAAAQAMLAEATGNVGRAGARRTIGKLLAMRGEIEAGREQVAAGNEGMREAGRLVQAAAGSQIVAFVEIRGNARDVGEAVLRNGLVELEHIGLSYRGTTALMLVDLLLRRGADDEAASWCAVAREVMTEDDLTDVIAVDALEGFLAARNGDIAEGDRLSARAVAVASTVDLYEHKALAYEWRARTLALVGKPDEAREAAAVALAVYEAKGDIPATAWVRELLDSLSD
jgi:hypothetical protein